MCKGITGGLGRIVPRSATGGIIQEHGTDHLLRKACSRNTSLSSGSPHGSCRADGHGVKSFAGNACPGFTRVMRYISAVRPCCDQDRGMLPGLHSNHSRSKPRRRMTARSPPVHAAIVADGNIVVFVLYLSIVTTNRDKPIAINADITQGKNSGRHVALHRYRNLLPRLTLIRGDEYACRGRCGILCGQFRQTAESNK